MEGDDWLKHAFRAIFGGYGGKIITFQTLVS